jgi:hypothetical protein
MQQSPRYIEPTPGARLKLAVGTGASILVGVAFSYWVQPKLRWVASLSTCESLPYVRAELLVAIVLVWFMATVLYRSAAKIWRLGQSPVPGTWVWSRTPIRTGARAKFEAVALYCLSAALFVGPAVLVLWQRLYLVFCFPQACGC